MPFALHGLRLPRRRTGCRDSGKAAEGSGGLEGRKAQEDQAESVAAFISLSRLGPDQFDVTDAYAIHRGRLKRGRTLQLGPT